MITPLAFFVLSMILVIPSAAAEEATRQSGG
jgi:hypothetical protein